MTTLVQDTKRSSTFANRISLGAIALILAALALYVGIILSINTTGNPHTEQVQVVLKGCISPYCVSQAALAQRVSKEPSNTAARIRIMFSAPRRDQYMPGPSRRCLNCLTSLSTLPEPIG